MKPLILGHGLLGSEIYKQTNWDYISRKQNNIDINDEFSYIDKLSDYDTIINCIGYTKTLDNTKEKHWLTNYLGVIKLVNVCNHMSKKLIHISTDYIYSNSKSCASETDVPIHNDSWYTYTKLLADGYVQAAAYNYLLIRASFKPKPFPWNTAWIDLVSNFDYTDVIASIIIKLTNLESMGVYNVGTELKTPYDLAKQTRTCEPIIDDYKFIRPHDVTMNLDKLKKQLNG
jgi:dTDP-4-dehydrorhamnose reductase